MDLLPPAIGAGDETESKTMTKHTSLSTLSTAELVNVFNLVSDGPEVKRFENRGVALARTARILTEKGKTLDGVLVSLGLAPAPVVEAPSPKAVIDQAEAAKGRALTETEQRRLARRVAPKTARGKAKELDALAEEVSPMPAVRPAARMRYFAGTDGKVTIFRASATMAYQSGTASGRYNGLAFSQTPAKFAGFGFFPVNEITKSEYEALVARKIERVKAAGLDPKRYNSPQDSWIDNKSSPLAVAALTVPRNHPNQCPKCGHKSPNYRAAIAHVCGDKVNFTYSRGHAAHFGNRQVSVPDQVADDQRGFADADRPFPALLPRGEGVVTVRIDAEATGLGTGGTGDLVVVAAKVAKSTAPAKADRKAPKSGNGETKARAHGQTRAIIVATMSRDGGATAAELYAATGWTQTSWNHQLNVAAKASGLVARKDKVDGATTYALVKG